MQEKLETAVIGLGYLSLSLAHPFLREYTAIGFDIRQGRVNVLMAGHGIM